MSTEHTPAHTRWTPRRALVLSIAAATTTMALKAIAWWSTGSVGYLSDAIESVVNLTGATFAFAMVTYARMPADDGHPYGHGKAEYFSAGFEGSMIFVAALAILVAAVDRLVHPQAIGSLGLGTALSVAASVLNFAVARLLFRVGRAHRSLALEADARHLMTDVWTTAGIIVAVVLATLSGWRWLDPVVAIVVSLNILREGFLLLGRSAAGLMDHALDAAQIARIEAVLRAFTPERSACENLRTRASGPLQFAHIDLRVPGDWTVAEAHELADVLEHEVELQTGTRLTTHIEPLPVPTTPST